MNKFENKKKLNLDVAIKPKRMDAIKQRMQNVSRVSALMYFFCIVVLLLVYHMFSDGDFSFLLTLSEMLKCFAFIMLLTHLVRDKTAAGVSAKTLFLFVLAFVSRLLCVWFYEGYLPLDKSGDFIPYLQIISILVVAGNLFVVLSVFRGSYAMEDDCFGKGVVKAIPHQVAGPAYIILPCFFVSVLFHPNLNKNMITDTAWTFGALLEATAVLPQLYMFTKSKQLIEKWTSHFVFILACGRILSFLFWLSSHSELSDSKSMFGWIAGYVILLSEFIGLALVGDYSYYYIVAAQAGTELSGFAGLGV